MWVGCECLLKSNNDQVKPENTVKLRIRKNKNIPAKYLLTKKYSNLHENTILIQKIAIQLYS